jgi:hypothetical protein
MMLSRSKILLAFDTGSVQGARLEQGLRSRRFTAFARRPLEMGALRPLPLETNLVRAEEVRQAARAVVMELGGVGKPGILVLPDGVARLALVDVPAGTDPRDYAHFRLGPQLPYPAADAIVDASALGGGRYIAAAVRRDIAAEYETLAQAAGLVPDRVDLSPLAAIAVLAAEHRRETPGASMDVVLGEAAFSMALFGGNAALALRNRRRDPGPHDGDRIGAEVERTALLGAAGTAPRVRVVGSGARRVAESLRASGFDARTGWGEIPNVSLSDSEELAWLGAGLA